MKKENQPETSEAKKMTVEKSVKNDNTYLQVDLTKKVVDFKFERQENFEKIRRKFEEKPKCTGKESEEVKTVKNLRKKSERRTKTTTRKDGRHSGE